MVNVLPTIEFVMDKAVWNDVLLINYIYLSYRSKNIIRINFFLNALRNKIITWLFVRSTKEMHKQEWGKKKVIGKIKLTKQWI